MLDCTKCKQTLPFEAFSKNSQKKRGYQYFCKHCSTSNNKEWKLNNPEMVKQAHKRDYDKNREERIATAIKCWANRDPEDRAAYRRYRRSTNPNIRTQERQSYFERSKRSPKWLSSLHRKEIEDTYLLRDEVKLLTGDDYHVDHIIPLRGKNVCGLHVPWNLQVLPADINMSKSNHYGAVQ